MMNGSDILLMRLSLFYSPSHSTSIELDMSSIQWDSISKNSLLWLLTNSDSTRSHFESVIGSGESCKQAGPRMKVPAIFSGTCDASLVFPLRSCAMTAQESNFRLAEFVSPYFLSE